MIACMGGWCKKRQVCQHYYAVSSITVERLCGNIDEPEPIKETKNDDVPMRWLDRHSVLDPRPNSISVLGLQKIRNLSTAED